MPTANKLLTELIDNTNSRITVPSGGINFGTTTDGTGTVTSGLMDDYEEGTFTPSYSSSHISSISYGSGRNGYYTKIGRLVTVTINIMTSSVTTSGSTEFLKISGLPFTSSSASESTNTVNISTSSRFASSPPVSGNIQNTQDSIYLLSTAYTTADDETYTNAGNLTTGTSSNRNTLRLTATYFTD